MNNPKKGQYQWGINNHIYGYTDTKKEAIERAVAKCLKDASFYTYPRPWFVGIVVCVETYRVEVGYKGPCKRTTVVTSTVAFGHGSHFDVEINIPKGMAQGRVR